MSKATYLHRYFTIIKAIQTRPFISKLELLSTVEKNLEYNGLTPTGKTKRTVERDLKDIYLLFGIQIEHCRKRKGYHIAESIGENAYAQRLLESFNVFSMLNLAQDLQPLILLENRKPQGTAHFADLLKAIRSKHQVQFSYQKFWEGAPASRIVEPYALKEFRQRWYLLAKDKSGITKTFGLDRMSNVETTRQPFALPVDDNPGEQFNNCFGIMGPSEKDEVQNIILSFQAFEGKYIKTMPLHSSQQILVDDEQEFRISLQLYITHELIMELLSHGATVKVLQPVSLAKQLQQVYKEANEQYTNGPKRQ